MTKNPLLSESTLPYHYPPFDQIKDEHFQPAIEQGMQEQLREVEAIAAVSDKARLKTHEMPAYWRLMKWARAQSFDELEERAIRKRTVYLPDHPWLPKARTGREFVLAVGRIYDVEDEALIDRLVTSGHPSTPGYNDPAYPIEGRRPRTSA
jgi:hypothetical protein